LPGVSVVVKGTTIGTTTDSDGVYSINVGSSDAVLVFSFIGFTTQEVPVQNRTVIDIAMAEDITQLNEVVVTGFGESKEVERLTFAVQDVQGNDLIRANSANVVNALQGKVAGVHIDQGTGGPMSSSRIRIRGNSSLSNNTQPLIVIDGVLIRPGVSGADSWGAAQDNGNIMKNINPDNIESMTVLKGSAASALYGSDALNGVILITTKSGVAREGLGISFNHTSSFEKAYRFIDVQNEFGAGISPEFETDNGVPFVDPNNWFYSYGPRFDGQMVRDLDGRMIPWVANDPLSFYETGKFINNNVVVEGGTDRSTFRASYSNLRNTTIMPSGTEMNRNNFSIRATQKIGKIFDLDAVVDYTHNLIKNPIRQGGNFNPVFAMVYYRPRSMDIGYWMNNYRDEVNGGRKTGVNDPYSITSFLWDTFEDLTEQRESIFRTNLDLNTHITPWLTLLVRGNVQNELYRGERRRLGNQPKFAGGQYHETTSDNWQYRVQSLLTANRELSDRFFLSLTLGGETNKLNGGRYYRVFTRNAGGGEDNSLKVPGEFSIANSINTPGIDTRLNPSRLKNAWYVYGDLTYLDMLTLNFSYRTDYSSTLAYADGTGDWSYSYPAVGLAWTFTQTLQSSLPEWLSFGKLRANFGITGGDTDPWIINETGSYATKPEYFFPGGSINYSGFRDSTLPNKGLKNREAREWEIGADLRFFNNRIGLDISYYQKLSRNEIFSLPVASESGVSARIVNGGEIENKGIELILTATPVSTGTFEWNTMFNFTRNRNYVLSLPEGVTSQQLSLAFGADVYSIAKPGTEYATIATPYAYATYQKRDAQGNPIDHPNNGKRVLGAASGTGGYYTFLRSGAYGQGEKELGSAMEKFLLSNINTLSYKNVSLNIQVDAKIGGLMASATHQYGSSNGSLKNSLFGRNAELGGVTYEDENGVMRDDGIIPDGVLADGIKSILDPDFDLGGMTYAEAVDQGHLKPIPALFYYENLTQWSSGIREYSIFENSWVSLREVSLGYDVPLSLASRLKLQNLRVSVVGRNLVYLYRTAKDGINPEGLKSNFAGEFAEYGGLPFTRQIGFSVNAGF
jgi:iron complex outermembrane receptor protein